MSFIGQFRLFVATFASWIIIPIAGWRAMFVIAGIGGLIVYLARKNLPESPRWLSNQGREEEAEIIVRHIETKYYNDKLPPVSAKSANIEVKKVQVSPFDPRFRKRVFLGSLMMVV